MNERESVRVKRVWATNNVAEVYDVKLFCGSAVDSYSIMANAWANFKHSIICS